MQNNANYKLKLKSKPSLAHLKPTVDKLLSTDLVTQIQMQTNQCVTHKQLETHGCIFSTVATDAMVLKHQGISIHSTDCILIYWTSFIQRYHSFREQYQTTKWHFEKKKRILSCLRVNHWAGGSYICQSNGSSVLQVIMVCDLFRIQPPYEPILTYLEMKLKIWNKSNFNHKRIVFITKRYSSKWC